MATTQTPAAERARLSKQAVVARALALADANGLDGLTIRALAQDLGVTPMALYWHFRSKEELLNGLADQVWAEMNAKVDAAQPWSRQLQGLLETQKQSEGFLQATEVTLEVLRGAGFDPRHASEVARSALWTGLMLVMSEPGIHPGMSDKDRAEHQRHVMVRMAMLPPDRYPRVVECAVPLTACDNPEFHYRLGIDVFIAGVEAIAARLSDGAGAD